MPLAKLALEAVAMNEAALRGDMDEARFRVELIASRAYATGHLELASMAERTSRILGPRGTVPGAGHGHGMLAVTHIIGALMGAPPA